MYDLLNMENHRGRSMSFAKCLRCSCNFKPIGETDVMCYNCHTEKLRRNCDQCGMSFLPIRNHRKCIMCRSSDDVRIHCSKCGNRFMPKKMTDRMCLMCSNDVDVDLSSFLMKN